MSRVDFPLNTLPLPAEDIVGREDVLNNMVDRMLHQQSILIPGPRRTGKTAVALELLRRLRDQHQMLVASVDLFECADGRDLSRKIVTACLENIDAKWTRFRSVVDRDLAVGIRESSLTIRILGVDLIKWAYHLEKLETGELLDRALDFPEAMAQRLGRPMALVFDEFQEASGLGGEALMKRMRAHWQRQRRTSYCFLGSQGGVMRDLFGQSRQPLYRFADILPLPPIPVADWIVYARSKFEAQGITVREASLEELVVRTGGHPFDTMKVLQHLARIQDRETAPVITRDLCWLAHQEAAEELARYFEAEIAGLQLPYARAMLLRLARGEGLYVPGINPGQNKRTVDGLVRAGVLRRVAPRRYQFEEPMLAEFLAQH
ncbi:AAA family ATPase [Sulfobacillus harzensis]|uniref:ATP-binding protein n=1 Tax=Sulfobacillus harzensis TaxID=2729629 RepID=A0A7Y0L3R4_9FIRM|nr:AAA family ATPase [Sulfobacillus harzensis]NMP22151.1 ATP-binding protein [Sulfobacillus harzensis]